MIKCILSVLAFILAFTGAFAQAEIVTVPGSQARLLNHTVLPSEAFEVRFSVYCKTSRFEDCGSYEQTKFLDPDGTYTISEFTLDAKSSSPSDRRYSLYVFISVPEGHPQRPNGVASSGYTASITKRGTTLDKLVAQSFTLHHAAAGALDIKLASGRALADYLANEGRDGGVKIELDFALSGGRNRDAVHTLDQTGFTRKNWVDMAANYFMSAGEYAADATFDFEIREKHQIIKSGRAKFQSQLAAVIGQIPIDDRQSDVNVAERRLTGSFADSYFQLDYPYQDQMEFAEIGFSYATLNAECVNGKVVGELIYREGQFTDEPETGRVPVAGTCIGDTGEIVWNMKRKNGRVETLTAKYARIQAQNRIADNGTKSISRLLFSDDVRDMLGEFKGEELNIFMPTYFADGTYAGQLRVATDN